MRPSPFSKPTTAKLIAAALLIAAAVLGSGASLAQSTAAPATLAGDPVHGRSLYQGCESCHSLNENDVGPKHRGVVGRKAGTVPDYAYSAALKNSGVVWDEASLNRWLINPSAMVPGTKMFFKIDDAKSRADIIAYLKQQK